VKTMPTTAAVPFIRSLQGSLRRALPVLSMALPLLAGGGHALADPAADRIPLCKGLTVVTAVSEPTGDYESIKRVEAMDAEGIHLHVSADRPKAPGLLDALGGAAGVEGLLKGLGGASGAEGVLKGLGGGDLQGAQKGAGGASGEGKPEIQHLSSTRVVLPDDQRAARVYQQVFGSEMPDRMPGSTAIGVSAAVLDDLKTKGEAELGCADPDALRGLGGLLSAGAPASAVSGTLRRLGEAVPVSVLVNDRRVNLQALHAKGTLGDMEAEFFLLDDPENPIALRYKIGRDVLTVVRISFPIGNAAPRIEQALEQEGRAEIHDITFDFGSATIKKESEPVLQEIAGLMGRHADWQLSVEGQTDSVGSEQANLELSRRRAAAVKQALVSRSSVAAERLTTTGFGESRPKETNDTLEGRARNRRVELVRK